MENTLVIGEYPPDVDVAELREKVVPRILAHSPNVLRVTAYRRLDGPDTYAYWLLVDLGAPQEAPALAALVGDSAGAAQAYHEVWRMARDEWGIGQCISSSAELETTPDSILTVILPVPPGRAGDWNRWYDGHHMPTVMQIAPAIVVGHRYAPVSEPSTGDYLVLYEFSSREALAEWQAGSTVAAKHNEYKEKWGVQNIRRAWAMEFRVERNDA
jgi:hypothetical protein